MSIPEVLTAASVADHIDELDLPFRSAAAAFAPAAKRPVPLSRLPTASDFFGRPAARSPTTVLSLIQRLEESASASSSPAEARSSPAEASSSPAESQAFERESRGGEGGLGDSSKTTESSPAERQSEAGDEVLEPSRQPQDGQEASEAQSPALSVPNAVQNPAGTGQRQRPKVAPLEISHLPQQQHFSSIHDSAAATSYGEEQALRSSDDNGQQDREAAKFPEGSFNLKAEQWDSFDGVLASRSSSVDSDTNLSPISPLSPHLSPPPKPEPEEEQEDDPYSYRNSKPLPEDLRYSSDRDEDADRFAEAYRSYVMENGGPGSMQAQPKSTANTRWSAIVEPEKPQEDSTEQFKITRDLARQAILDDLSSRGQSDIVNLKSELEALKRAHEKDKKAWRAETLKLKLELRRAHDESLQRQKEQRQRYFRERHQQEKLARKGSTGSGEMSERLTVEIGIQVGSSEGGPAADIDGELVEENAHLKREILRLREENERVLRQIQAKKANTYGNTAFSQGKFEDALKHYGAALAAKMEDPKFNCVLHCNRSAASQALDRQMDALADCIAAVRVDPSYSRALHARADVFVLIGDVDSALDDLIELESRGDKEACKKLPEIRRRQKFQTALGSPEALNFYSILSVPPTSSVAEIKNAYKRLALRHHPDRAGPDANLVFKYISQAYQVLSDPDLRAKYDVVHAAIYVKLANGGPLKRSPSWVKGTQVPMSPTG